jgi:hypothetical protein
VYVGAVVGYGSTRMAKRSLFRRQLAILLLNVEMEMEELM